MDIDTFAKMGETALSAVKTLVVRSALNPMLWLCGLMTPCFLGAAYMVKDIPSAFAALLVMAGIPTVSTCIGFFYLAIAKPEKLQSEEFQLRHEALISVREKGHKPEVVPVDINELVNQGDVRLLTDKKEEAKP